MKKLILVKLAGYLLISLFCLGGIALSLRMFDYFLGYNIELLPGHDLEQSQKTARTLELFPFTGWHMQANTAVADFRLGTMGFAIDFDLNAPPAKEAAEYRIILIGGSGAQGWGASATRTTMAALLQDHLNGMNDGRTYKVINMAMGSSMTYQNFIALNRWAHPLQPDLILSYSGVNDYTVPLFHEERVDAFYQFNRLNSLALASRGSEMPPQLKWLQWLMPNLMTQTTLGYGIKYGLYPEYFNTRAQASYRASRGLKELDNSAFLQDVVTPLYIHALRSIRRDFAKIPVLVVWQAMHKTETEMHLKIMPGLNANFYDEMYNSVRSSLSGQGWHFANFQQFNQSAPHPGVGVHPNDEGQAILAQYVFNQIVPILPPLGEAALRPTAN